VGGIHDVTGWFDPNTLPPFIFNYLKQADTRNLVDDLASKALR